MADIELSSVRKSYGNLEVIHGIDAHIKDGEFAVLVGPSGCGKSTLLRMLAGLENISGGSVSISGKIVNDLRPKERNIAMVFQNYALYPHMTVAENMAFSLKLSKAPKEEITQKVGRAADILGLGALLERFPRQLSGGQRQRVAMGRAIVRDPDVFLFDEPLSNLDAKLRVQMRTEIKALHQKLQSTIVYVTHDQIEAMTMADKIIVLKDGEISQTGTPLELYDSPKNRFVATFIGSPSMNILPGEIIDANTIRLDDGQVLRLPNSEATGKKVLVGIRPEDLSVNTDGEALQVTVDVVEPTGAETHLTCSGPSAPVLAAIRGRVDTKPKDKITFNFSVAKVHLFCAETELALSTGLVQ